QILVVRRNSGQQPALLSFVREINPPPLAAFVGKLTLTNWGSLADIATDLDLIVGATAGDKPTGICRRDGSSRNRALQRLGGRHDAYYISPDDCDAWCLAGGRRGCPNLAYAGGKTSLGADWQASRRTVSRRPHQRDKGSDYGRNEGGGIRDR